MRRLVVAASLALLLAGEAHGQALTGQLPLTGSQARSQSAVASPAAPASTSAYKMQGLAGSITPGATGSVLIVISGTCVASTVTAGDGIQFQLSYGTGTPPSNAGALAGTQAGTVQTCENPTTITAADVASPFSVQAVVTGLATGTAYWIDLAAESVGTASSDSLSAVSITAVELH